MIAKEIFNRMVARAIEIVVIDGNTIENVAALMACTNGLMPREQERLEREMRKTLPDFD
jgi:hypothetical protein